ncbi:E3 SUMO-protein ligase ZBED1-like isoform X2 [Pseudoliparis swirei]|nr:E3 SUMO-protein ligase ZBED1-like isoform X2 [Pseudoliparis swirei]
MVERFVEQYPAIQAAFLDPRAKKLMKRDRLEEITDEDFRRAEDFVSLMRMLYTSTLCVSSDKSSTCGQIIPILQKLKTHLTVKEEDSTFVATVKEKVWGDLSKRYQDHDIMAFLEEATLMDPRFKGKLSSSDEVWERLKAAALREMLGEEDAVPVEAQEVEVDEDEEEEVENPHVVKKPRVSALEELFAEEDKELRRSLIQQETTAPTILENIRNELSVYRGLLPIPTSEDPVHWWWRKKETFPVLSQLSTTYLCVQASSTPSERVFSTAGNTLSKERSRLLPEKVNMLIFLNKNC